MNRSASHSGFATLLTALTFALGLAACSPKVYVIDRQTMLEQDAAGEWPQFEKDLLSRSASQGPTPFGKRPPSLEQRRLYNVLNGELVASAPATASAPAPAKPAEGSRK